MSIGIPTPGVHHIALRTTDLHRARRFYADTLGFPVVMEVPGLFLFLAGRTAIAVRGPESHTPPDDVFSPFRAGLDHLALACAEESELQRVATALVAAGVENTGIKIDPMLNRRYVAFKDPDRIAWELYMAPDPNRAAVQAYFDGLKSKNVDNVPLSPKVRFEGPLGPPLEGDDAVRTFLTGVFPIIDDVRVQHTIADGEHIGVRFELETVYGTIPAFDWFHVVDGAIAEVRPFYDPRPITTATLKASRQDTRDVRTSA